MELGRSSIQGMFEKNVLTFNRGWEHL